jgi:UDP-3-O-[3-hydroxymyristoyl] glucosamine N-acyltransferase
MPTNLSLSALAHICGGAVYGSSDPLISCVASAEKASANAITFAVDSRRAAALFGTAATAVIVREVDIASTGIKCGIVHPDPYFAYAKIAQAFAPRARANPGIHPSAIPRPRLVR